MSPLKTGIFLHYHRRMNNILPLEKLSESVNLEVSPDVSCCKKSHPMHLVVGDHNEDISLSMVVIQFDYEAMVSGRDDIKMREELIWSLKIEVVRV